MRLSEQFSGSRWSGRDRLRVRPGLARGSLAFFCGVALTGCSLDASRWRLAYPKDGIADSRREDFEVRLEENESARSVIIRATDAMNNVATSVAEIPR